MPLQNRIAACDICRHEQQELRMNAGWPGWSHITGIGAFKPKQGEPLTEANTSVWLCPACTEALSDYLTEKQQMRGNES